MEALARDPVRASERIGLRLQPGQKATLVKAARLRGVTVAELIRDSALEAAERVLREETTMLVPQRYFDELLAALDAPVVANAALRRAISEAASVDRR